MLFENEFTFVDTGIIWVKEIVNEVTYMKMTPIFSCAG